ncbi:MAG: glucosamine--fructose-6-phosphate aminotransferase (isomerizing) [Acidimicrobiales bacterium]|jgi:glucosamine--fructose-6-phosphate aminotransferase (isomerizing)
MCGIIAIVRRRTQRATPDTAELLQQLATASEALPAPADVDLTAALIATGEVLTGIDLQLRGEAGLQAMLGDSALVAGLDSRLGEITESLALIEAHLDLEGDRIDDLEAVNVALIAAKDAAWAMQRDRLRTAREVGTLAGKDPASAKVAAYFSIQQALSGLDRLEVRGRDSAGVHVLVRNHGLDLDDEAIQAMVAARSGGGLFADGAVRTASGHLSFIYKAAAEIGELGDNTKSMRASIQADDLLRAALESEAAEATVLGHTRWASVGIISEPNAHPVNSDESGREAGPYVTATLNGDVDNFSDLIAAEKLSIPGEITTDAKVIPTLVSRGLAGGHDLDESVRRAVAQFEGSVAIGISSAEAPDDVHLALRGSGQGVFIGLAEDAFVVASEPYGVVEDATSYIRMDGETPADLDNPTTSQGQIVRISGSLAGGPEAITRFAYDGTPLPVSDGEWKAPDVTTRDIDRGDADHFLLKEISESPNSFSKTLRGRLIEQDGALHVRLPPEAMPESVARRIRSGAIRRVEVIGQGTAAVAGQAVAAAFEWALQGSEIPVRAITATELSGFNLRDDMSDTLAIAISQSGTTTDTNRTVDLARGRGAVVLAIVNRRGSDLVDKADGVLYTSDGRDVEMSVASTKAFYAQIAAGFLVALGVSDLVDGRSLSVAEQQALLESLRSLPDAMRATLAKRPEIAAAAGRHAPSRRYWAMVGNGANVVAARELRIKLSELCYKSIACDVTEDKKHIDLSSEPMILVCAAGLVGSNADDVAKEVAIFRAHKAAPIVIATEGENRFSAALDVIAVPEAHPLLAFVLSTVVGHLFGYEAALAIDASARPLREARGIIEQHVGATGDDWFDSFSGSLEPLATRFFEQLRSGHYNGHLEASTASRLAVLLRFATRAVPFDSYQIEMGKVGTPGVIVEDLAVALTAAIEELTRPIDAIKHQAKTVTVGISRADESLLQAGLIQEVLGTGCPRDRLSYRSLRSLAALSPAVEEVVGYTRYRIEGNPDTGSQIFVVDRSGLAASLSSRVEKDPTLRGTKHRVAVEREPFVTVGSDGRVVLIVPEIKDGESTGLTLCHLKLREDLGVATARSVLQGYHNRYRQLVDVVTEREPSFREDLLAEVPTVELLTAPISDVASRWEALA